MSPHTTRPNDALQRFEAAEGGCAGSLSFCRYPFTRSVLLIVLLALCGCSPSSKDIVGDWARPLGLRIWDGHVTGQDQVMRFSPDGTYRVFDDAASYNDQFSDRIHFSNGHRPPSWTGKWELKGDQILFFPDGHNASGIPFKIGRVTSMTFEVSLGNGLRPFTFHRTSLTNRQDIAQGGI